MYTMEKKYIVPTTKFISIDAEDMIALSGGDVSNTEKEAGDAMTQRQQGGNSIWDTWSN